MLIYLAHPADPSGQQSISQAVKDRGLSLFRAKPCDVRISVIPDVIQPGYMSYTRNLPAFMEATLTQQVVTIRNRGYPISTVPHMIPMSIPPLIYDFQAKPSEAKVTKLRDHSTVTQGRGKTVSFIMQTPTLDLIQDVAKQGANQTTSHVFGTVNLTGMKCVFVLQKILSAFLLTHVYPAFRHAEEMTPVEEPQEVSIKRRKTNQSTYLLCVSKPDEHLEDAKPSAEESKEGDTQMSDTYDPTTMIRLVNAKPSQIQNDRWGPVGNIPNCSGIFVPFVAELAVEDPLTVPMLVSTYFLRSLASTHASMISQMDSIRSGWSMVASTRLGHEWSHLAKCIDVALQAQCFVYPIYTNDVYEGTVICGAGYRVGLRDRMFGPVAYDELQKAVRDNTMHRKSLNEIIGIVGDEHEHDISVCEDMRTLSKLLLTLPLDEVSKGQIVKAAMKLNFRNKYWSTSAAKTQLALHYLANPDESIPSDIPMYPKYIFSVDRDERVLSAFGHSAPTFMIPNGRKCEMKNMETPPKNLTVRTVTVETAVLDLKYIREQGYITNNLTNLSAKHKDVPIKSEFKKDIWRLLRTITQREGDSSDSPMIADVVSGTGVGKAVDDDLW